MFETGTVLFPAGQSSFLTLEGGCFLSKEIRTNRKDDLGLLLKIRTGGFQKADGTFQAEFYEIVSDYEKKLEEAAARSMLPDEPDMKQVGDFVEYVNLRSIQGGF